jgi:dTDP-4-amino-4,6-dideoxygalactose transaminase
MKGRLTPIYVTKPSVPPLEDFTKYLEEIWEARILTNNGPFLKRFEKALAEYLGVRHVSIFTNGTLALMTALRALEISGEVITTPFTFVATAHSLLWNNLVPVFADIDPVSLNLDPLKVEKAITGRTKAILPVHVFGTPCNVMQFEQIGEKYNLKIIYDAAHAFGTMINKTSVLNFGDMSVLSFHATKLFNTCEGGAVICQNDKSKKQLELLKNFGIEDQVTISEVGINGKMNELQAAFGLLQLRQIEKVNEKCRIIADEYRAKLSDTTGLKLLYEENDVKKSHSFFPILVDAKKYGQTRDEVYEKMKKNNVFCRKYFYPLVSNIKPYNAIISANPANLENAVRISGQILCLPIYPDLSLEDVRDISKLLIR